MLKGNTMRTYSKRTVLNASLLVPIAALATFAVVQAMDGSYCEELRYGESPILLSIDEAYYRLPRRADSLISLSVRYRDYAPTGNQRGTYDPQELNNPSWTLETSAASGLLQIYRQDLKWPSTVEELSAAYPNGSVVETDWPGWIKFLKCSYCTTAYTSAAYLNPHLRLNGLDYVECPEIKNYDPTLLRCSAHDHIQGVEVEYHFPSLKKKNFEEFRQRMVGFIQMLQSEGAKECKAQ